MRIPGHLEFPAASQPVNRLLWENFYEKYSPVFMGALSIFENKGYDAAETLLELFDDIRHSSQQQTSRFDSMGKAYCYALGFALNKLEQDELIPVVKNIHSFPLPVQRLLKRYKAIEPGSEGYILYMKQQPVQRSYYFLAVYGANPYKVR